VREKEVGSRCESKRRRRRRRKRRKRKKKKRRKKKERKRKKKERRKEAGGSGSWPLEKKKNPTVVFFSFFSFLSSLCLFCSNRRSFAKNESLRRIEPTARWLKTICNSMGSREAMAKKREAAVGFVSAVVVVVVVRAGLS